MLALRLAVFEHLVDVGRIDGAARASSAATGRCGSARAPPRPPSSAAPRWRPPCRCWPGPRRSSATSRSATAAPSAARSPTPTRPPSTRRWPSPSTPSWRRCRRAGRRTIPAAEFFTGLWTHRPRARRAARRRVVPGVDRAVRVRRRGAGPPARRLRRRRRRGRRRARRRRPGRGGAPSASSASARRPLRATAAEAAVVGRRRRRRRRRRGRPARPWPTWTTCPSDLHGSADYRRRVGAVMVGPGLDGAPSRRHAVAEVEVEVTVNGAARRGAGRAPADAGRLPARALPPHRHAPRVRARRLRRVHGAARRRGRAVVPHVRRAGRRAPRSPRSRASRRPTASSRPCRRRSATATACSAGSARPGFVVSVTAFLRDNPEPDRRRDPRRRCRATCAAAPATRASSRRCARRPTPAPTADRRPGRRPVAPGRVAAAMSTSERRKYDSPVRRQQAADTRERIVAAGADLVHGFDRWDWREPDRAGRGRAGRRERAHRLPVLRQRARAARGGDAPPGGGGRRSRSTGLALDRPPGGRSPGSSPTCRRSPCRRRATHRPDLRGRRRAPAREALLAAVARAIDRDWSDDRARDGRRAARRAVERERLRAAGRGLGPRPRRRPREAITGLVGLLVDADRRRPAAVVRR